MQFLQTGQLSYFRNQLTREVHPCQTQTIGILEVLDIPGYRLRLHLVCSCNIYVFEIAEIEKAFRQFAADGIALQAQPFEFGQLAYFFRQRAETECRFHIIVNSNFLQLGQVCNLLREPAVKTITI